jgi:hypothetical protein
MISHSNNPVIKTLLILLFIYLSATGLSADEILIWTDDKGVTHIEMKEGEQQQAQRSQPLQKPKVETQIEKKEPANYFKCVVKLFEGRSFVRSGFHKRIYGVWRFAVTEDSLDISGLYFNDWSGKVFGEYYFPHYQSMAWSQSFPLDSIDKIVLSLKKAKDWQKTASQNNVQDFEKKLTNLESKIQMIFRVYKTGRCVVIFRNPNWTFKGDHIDMVADVSGDVDAPSNWKLVNEIISAFESYKPVMENCQREKELKETEYRKKLEDRRNEKERIIKLFEEHPNSD